MEREIYTDAILEGDDTNTAFYAFGFDRRYELDDRVPHRPNHARHATGDIDQEHDVDGFVLTEAFERPRNLFPVNHDRHGVSVELHRCFTGEHTRDDHLGSSFGVPTDGAKRVEPLGQAVGITQAEGIAHLFIQRSTFSFHRFACRLQFNLQSDDFVDRKGRFHFDQLVGFEVRKQRFQYLTRVLFRSAERPRDRRSSRRQSPRCRRLARRSWSHPWNPCRGIFHTPNDLTGRNQKRQHHARPTNFIHETASYLALAYVERRPASF